MAASSSVSPSSPYPQLIQEAVHQQNLPLLQSLFEECMQKYQNGEVTRKTYTSCLRLIENNPDRLIQDLLLKVKDGICPLSTPKIDSSGYSYAQSLSNYVFGLVFDYNHPWKVQKYTIVLKEMEKGLRAAGMSPTEVAHKFSNPMTPFQLAVANVVLNIFIPNNEVYYSDRERYQFGVIKELRTILNNSDFTSLEEDPATEVLEMIARIRYTGVNVFHWSRQLVVMFIREGRKEILKWHMCSETRVEEENLLQLPLDWQLRAIDWVPKTLTAPTLALTAKRLKGHLGIDFDPSGQNNIPFVAYKWGSVTNIRMSTPTIQPLSITECTTVAPEFAYFIKSLAKKGETLFYVNLQINTHEGAEKSRTNQICALRDRYPDTLKLANLDMDSPFYSQLTIENQSIEDFRNSFLEELFKENSHYDLPNVAKEEIGMLFSLLENSVFHGQEILSIDERQTYIDLFYAIFILYTLRMNSINYFTIVCKDGLDRAGIIGALFRDLVMIIRDEEQDESHFIHMHAPTIMGKKIAMLEERRVRYLQAITLLYEPTIRERVRDRLREQFPDVPPLEVERRDDQVLA